VILRGAPAEIPSHDDRDGCILRSPALYTAPMASLGHPDIPVTAAKSSFAIDLHRGRIRYCRDRLAWVVYWRAEISRGLRQSDASDAPPVARS